MSNDGNNGKGPIPFAVKEDIPILGQPLTVLAWFPTVSVVCNCEAKQPLLLVGLGNLSVCPQCGRGFQLFGVQQSDIRTAQKAPNFNINIVLPGRRPEGDGDEHRPS